MLTPDVLPRLRAVLASALPDDQTGRRTILASVLIGSPIVDQIEYSGPSNTFLSNLILKLDSFGSVQPGVPALVALLQGVRDTVGYDKQVEIDSLIALLRPNVVPAVSVTITGNDAWKNPIITFLEGLTPTDLNRVIVRLGSAGSYVPDTVSHHNRVAALVQYVYSNGNSSVTALIDIINSLFPNKLSLPAATSPATVTSTVSSSAGTMATPSTVPSIFISYSHKDPEYLERLKVFTKPLERAGVLSVWSDTGIRTSQAWRQEIETAMQSAKGAVLLLSADFVASDFIADTELPTLLKAAKERGVKIFPVLLSPCNWDRRIPVLKEIQFANTPSTPLAALPKHEQDAIWQKLANDLEDLL